MALIEFKNKPNTDTPINATNLNNNFNEVHSVGSILITSTNVSPSNNLGGIWELIDKEFASLETSTSGFTPSENITSSIAYFSRAGHSIVFNLSFISITSLSDDTVEIGTINFEELGITNLPANVRECGWTDAGNAILMFQVNSSNGILQCLDIIGPETITANAYCYVTMPFTFDKSRMLDSACDKFYWKRIA